MINSVVMKKMIVTCLVLLAALSSCQKGGCKEAVKAEFKDLTGLDGCGIVIQLSDGSYIEPQNLSDFSITPEDGKKIWVQYHSTQGGSICMVGDIVKIDCISERK